MERDFMGSNSKDPVVIKEEFIEGDCEDSEFARSSGVPRPWSNKPSALPQFISPKCEHDKNSLKIKSDILASHAYMAKSGSEMCDAMHKRHSPNIENFGGANMKQQFLAGLSAPPVIPPMVGTSTEQWNKSKVSSASAQLTIFYGGTVNVFDDITPEKAQAIIFLAGNGFVASNVQASASKFNIALVNQPVNMAPSSRVPNPIPDDPSGTNSDDVIMVFKTGDMSTSVVNKVEPPRAVLPLRSVAASYMTFLAVPQARKASLARFLEKRKERALNAAPYNLSKHAADCATPELNGFGLSATSSPISISKRD